MSLAEKMVKYRAKHNLSQEEFANKAKVCLMTVSAIESGKRVPTALTRAKIEIAMMEDEKDVFQS